MGSLLTLLVATALVSACAATAPEGKLDPAEAEAAMNELFTAQGERVLMQAGDGSAAITAPSAATGAPVGPDGQPLVGVQTSDGLIWMTQAQLDQFIAQKRIEAAALAQTVNAYGTQPAAGAQAVAASATEATPAAARAASGRLTAMSPPG